MTWLRGSIGRKLILCFCVVIAFGLFGYVHVVRAMQTYMQAVNTTNATAHSVVSLAKTSADAFHEMSRDFLGYVYTGKQNYWDAKEKIDNLSDERFDAIQKEAKKLPHPERILAAWQSAQEQNDNNCTPVEDKMVDLVKDGKLPEAQALYEAKFAPATDRYTDLIEQVATEAETYAAASDAEIAKAGKQAILLGWFLQAGILLASLGIAFFWTRALTSQLKTLLFAARGLAAGDVDQTITAKSRDEIGQVSEAFVQMIAYQQEMAAVTARVAAGDLTVTLEPKGEKDALGSHFRQMIASLRQLIRTLAGNAETLAATGHQLAEAITETNRSSRAISDSIQQVAQAANQSATTSQEMAHGSEQQARSASEAAGAMEQLEAAVREVRSGNQQQEASIREADSEMQQAAQSVLEVARSTQQVVTAAQESSTVAQTGGKAVQQTIAGMGRIKE